jgi:hypothetical protein
MERPLSETARLVKDAARRVVGNDMPMDAWLQETATFDGDAAVKIVVLFPGSKIAEISGRQLVDIMVDIRQAMSRSGDPRSPLVSFARLEDEPELSCDRYRASA